MKTIKPSFYDDFFCLASACRHSCCIGWEIDIDEQTAALYASVDGELGAELKRAIAADPQPHFLLTPDQSCPFLRADKLCRLYLELGEDSLCDICTLHPRFFNSFPGREEAGLGLCCEEVVRLLLSTSAEPFLIEEDDGLADATDPRVEQLADLRGELLEQLLDSSKPFFQRLDSFRQRCGIDAPHFSGEKWKAFFLSLERMDEAWTTALCLLDRVGEQELRDTLREERYSRILCYLLYRHLINAETPAQERGILRFCLIGTMLVAALDAADPAQRDEHIRACSAEIEYSDENVEKICWNFP